jgi:hypothetical protein
VHRLLPARGLLGGLRAKRWRRGGTVARSASWQPRNSAWRPRLRRRSEKPLLWGAEGVLTAEPGAPRGSRRLQQQARHDVSGARRNAGWLAADGAGGHGELAAKHDDVTAAELLVGLSSASPRASPCLPSACCGWLPSRTW